MSLSMYQASIPAFIRQLNNLSAILAKGTANAAERNIDPSVFTSARLAPDMFPLTRQVQIAADIVKGCGARLAGVEIPSFADTETSFEELEARIRKTIAFLETLKPEQFEGSASKPIQIKVPNREFNFDGQSYLQSFALPNLHFHATAVYAILRHNGVPLGKSDYLGDL